MRGVESLYVRYGGGDELIGCMVLAIFFGWKMTCAASSVD